MFNVEGKKGHQDLANNWFCKLKAKGKLKLKPNAI